MNEIQKLEHVLLVAGQNHFIISSLASCYALFVLEDWRSLIFSTSSPKGRDLQFCKLNSLLLCFTIAYWFVDLLIILFVRTDRSKTTQQLIYHHFVGIYLLIACQWVGGAFPKVGHVTMTCETSNFFITLRDIMGKHNWNGPLADLNSVCFFVTYTLSRVFLFPIIIYMALVHNR